MIRRLLVLLVLALAVWVAGAPLVLAQDAANASVPTDLPASGWSGPGFYLNWFKILGSWLVFLLWVGTADWVSRDAVEMKLDYLLWNPIVVGSFMVAFIVLWLVPIFWVGLPILLLAYIAPLMAYVIYRNGKVQQHERVLTPAHIRYWVATRLSGVGVKVEAEKRDPHQVGVPVVLNPYGAPNERDSAARLLTARQSPGLLAARKLSADALYRRADAMMLDYTQQGAAIRYLIDGVWQNGEPLERETADPMLEAFKLLSGLNAQDRQSRQEGKYSVNYHVFKPLVFHHIDRAKDEYRKKMIVEAARELAGEGANPAEMEQRAKLAAEVRVRDRFASPIGAWTPVDRSDLSKLRGTDRVNPDNCLEMMQCVCTLASQGTPTGERVIIQLQIQKTRFATLDEIGMRPKMQEQLRELMHVEHGLVIFSAPPAGGLRTTMNVVLRASDRFVREFAAIEDVHNGYEAVENIPATTYDSAKGESPATVLPGVIHKEPNVLVVRDLVNPQSAKILLEQAEEHRIIVSTIRGVDCVDAICRVLALGASPADLAKALVAVFNQRLVRKLCDHCKEAYAPPPQVLQQLGLPPGRVQAFYRPPQQREEVCPECGGMGYRGRIAILELLQVDDNFRKVLAAQPKPGILRDAARKAGMRTLQEEGIVLVAKGTTSLPELIRVMKQ